jgi:hypothetical protein
MNRSLASFAALATTAMLAGACGFQHTTEVLIPTLPSGTSAPAAPAAPAPVAAAPAASILGTWASEALTPPSPSSCSNFQLHVTSQTATSLAGDFSATCAGGLTLSGSASGQLSGTNVTVNVAGNASLPNTPSCHFDLVGNGTIENADTLRIPYTGITCLGPVRGTEVLRRPAPASPPAPPAAPEPAPAPAPADPLLGCGGIGDHQKLVECIHDRVNPAHTPEGAFEVTKRVAWALKGEGAGLLIKNGGENIVSWHGRSFAAGRICYPDGHIYKVLTDVPATNGPSWQDNGFVDRSLYVPAIDPNS